MEFLLSLVPFVGEAVAVASIIASLTPTPKDDKILGKLYKVVDIMAINVGRAKEPTPRASNKKTKPK